MLGYAGAAICRVMGAKATDMTPATMTMEISDTPARVNDFETMMRSFNILEVARTGMIALQKGPDKM